MFLLAGAAAAGLLLGGELANSIISQGRGAMVRKFRSASPYMRFGRIRPNLQQDYATPPHNFT